MAEPKDLVALRVRQRAVHAVDNFLGLVMAVDIANSVTTSSFDMLPPTLTLRDIVRILWSSGIITETCTAKSASVS